MSSSSDHIYLDLGVVNNDNNGSQIKRNLQFSESRSSSILDNPSNYEMTVARFQMDTPNSSLPIFVPLLNVDGVNTDPNQTSYTIGMAQVDSTTGFQLKNLKYTNVKWTPEDLTAAPPANGTTPSPSATSTILSRVTAPTGAASYFPTTLTLSPNNLPADFALPLYAGSYVTDMNLYTLLWHCNFYEIRTIGTYILGLTGYALKIPNMSSRFPDFISGDIVLNPSAVVIANSGVSHISGQITLGTPYQIPSTPNTALFDWIFPITSPALVNYSLGPGTLSPGPDVFLNFVFNNGFSYNFITAVNMGANTFTLQSPAQYILPGTQMPSNPASYWEFYPTQPILKIQLVKNVPPILTSQSLASGYYNCYTPQWWINCVNNAMASLWTQFTSDGQVVVNPASSAPFIVLDSLTWMPSLLTPQFTDTSTIPPSVTQNFACNPADVTGNANNYPIYIGGDAFGVPLISYVMFMNEPLFNLFSSFSSVYYGNQFLAINEPLMPPFPISPPTQYPVFSDLASTALAKANPSLFNYYIQPVNLIKKTISTSLTLIVTYSEQSPIPMWSPIQSIRFSSSLLPNLVSYTTASVPYNQLGNDTNLQQNSGGNNSQISNKITDIQIGLTTGYEYKPTVSYTPKGEYRLIDLIGSQSIQTVDFIVSWIDKYGNEVPFRLAAQCGANLKLLFRRKRFNLLNVKPYNTN